MKPDPPRQPGIPRGLSIYIASFFDTRARLFPVRDRLRALGYFIMSTWLDEEAGATYAGSTEDYLLTCAMRDDVEIRRSDVLIVDTIDVTERGGREVEVGIAIGEGVPFIVVGPYRNVFHRLAQCHFDSWEELFAAVGDAE